MLRTVPEKTDSDPVSTLVRHEVDEFKGKKAAPKPEIRVPVSPRIKNFSASFTPKSEKHLSLLRGCLYYNGDMKSGKVDVPLNPEFVEWLKARSHDVLKEAYCEAVYLVADQGFRPVDVEGLIKEAKIETKWKRDDLVSIRAIHQNSIKLLHEYVAIRDAKSGPFTKEEHEQEYLAATADGNLESDFKHFSVAAKFAEMLKESDLSFFRDRKVSIAAFKRLQIAFMKQSI